MHFIAEGACLVFYSGDFTRDASGKLALTEKVKSDLCGIRENVAKIIFHTRDNDVFDCFAALNEELYPDPATASAAETTHLALEAVEKLRAVKTFSFEVGFSDQFNLERMKVGVDNLLRSSAEKELDINLLFSDVGYSVARSVNPERSDKKALSGSQKLLESYVTFCEGLPEKLAVPNLHIKAISNSIEDITLERLLSRCHDIESVSDLSLRRVTPALVETIRTSCRNLNEFRLTGPTITLTTKATTPGVHGTAEEVQYDRKLRDVVDLTPFTALESTHPNLRLALLETTHRDSSPSEFSTNIVPIAGLLGHMENNKETPKTPRQQRPERFAQVASAHQVADMARKKGGRCSIQ